MAAMIYLDYNATTPVDPRVAERAGEFAADVFGNPHSRDHRYGWDAADAIEKARAEVAALINAQPAEVFFTSGATESVNLALRGLAQTPTPGRNRVVTFATEHEAVLETCRSMSQRWQVPYTIVPLDDTGGPDLDELERCLRGDDCVVLALMAANNETGDIYDVTAASQLARDHGVLFFCDAAQAAGKIRIDVRAEGIDLLALAAHKIYGFKGVGALFVRGGRADIQLAPLVTGGGQERGLRAGTLNVPGIVGFGEACRLALDSCDSEATRLGALRDRLERNILAELPWVTVNGNARRRLDNTSSLCFHGLDARALIRDMHHVAVATRSACSSGAAGPSHVLKAIGLSDDDAYGSVRFSLGRFSTQTEIDEAVAASVLSARKLRAAAGSVRSRL